MRPKRILRDLVLLALATVAWWADGALHADGGPLAWVVAVLATIVLEAPTTFGVARGAQCPRAPIEVAPRDEGRSPATPPRR